MRVAIMQPYFFPYIGYFQLIAAVDLFVIYDNIKYTKKGWINRNRMLQNGKDVMFTIPLKSDSDFLEICEREISTDFNRDKFLNQFKETYKRAPYFSQTFPLVEKIVNYNNVNLFHFLHNSLVRTCEHLGLTTNIRLSSDISINHELRSQCKVLALCNAVEANTYINSIGGIELYSKEIFRENGLDLKFLKSKPFDYKQFGNSFIPWLSIIDVMMFNSTDTIRSCILTNYELI